VGFGIMRQNSKLLPGAKTQDVDDSTLRLKPSAGAMRQERILIFRGD
jgi:hypothetical protein